MVNEVMKFITEQDPEVGKAIGAEAARQRRNLELIASENIVSEPVMMAMGTVLTNKYAEGYSGKRYYGCLLYTSGGGILIAIAFLLDGLSVDLNALPADQRGNFGTITPMAAFFKGIGGTAFGFMLPVLAGFIAMAIGDRPALALGLSLIHI